jgi:hypothetical protein
MERLFEEIKELKNDPSHKSALRIYKILENNRRIFTAKIDAELYDLMLSNFDELAHTQPGKYFTADFKDEFLRHYEMLYYNLNKVI